MDLVLIEAFIRSILSSYSLNHIIYVKNDLTIKIFCLEL